MSRSHAATASPGSCSLPQASSARSLLGAVLAAALVSLEHGGTTSQVQAAARRAMHIAIGGLRPAGHVAPPPRDGQGGPASEPARPAREKGNGCESS
jgi:hypothetical protein